MPPAKSGEVDRALTPEIMLLAIVVVPDETEETEMPTAEKPVALVDVTVPMTLPVIVALVTSLPVVLLTPMEVAENPAAIAVRVLPVLRPEILLLVIWIPSSNPTTTPQNWTLFGEAELIRFWVMMLPVFLLAALAPCE